MPPTGIALDDADHRQRRSHHYDFKHNFDHVHKSDNNALVNTDNSNHSAAGDNHKEDDTYMEIRKMTRYCCCFFFVRMLRKIYVSIYVEEEREGRGDVLLKHCIGTVSGYNFLIFSTRI